MKKYIFSTALFLFAALLGASCSENFMESDKGSTELALTSSQSDVVLAEKTHNADGVALSWTTGTNYGTGNRINYTLELALDGTNYANPITLDMGDETYSWSKTQGDLNKLLADNFGLKNGAQATIDARITAKVAGYDDKTQQAETKFNVTTYEPVTTTLYMIGDATPTGWSVDNPTVMKQTDAGIFTATVRLRSSGAFKFITSKGSFVPSYNKDASDASGMKLVLRKSFDDPDEQFKVADDGIYDVTVNLLDLTLTLKASTVVSDRFDMVYFVGSFTDWGFKDMAKDVLRRNLWHYGAVLNWNNGGEFKFATVKDWKDMLTATEAEAPYTSTGVVYQGADNKWFLPQDLCGKAYKIALDVTKGAEKMVMKPFTPYPALYLVGDATPNGWNLGNATEMTKVNDYEFSWSGKLVAGEMKISCDKKSDWSGAWFMAASAGAVPTGAVEQAVFVDKSDDAFKALYPDIAIGDVDMKWKIADSGNYTITINQLTETITIAKH